jgi:5-methyltetrahydrofolate--homocysteine methyltransferase
MHDIGKNIVGIMLQGAGIEVIDLGVNIPPEQFVAAIKEHNPALVGMSALLTTTMAWMKKTTEALTAAGVRSQVKVMIGGAPVTQRFADEIGADGFSRDAAGAAIIAKELLAKATVAS